MDSFKRLGQSLPKFNSLNKVLITQNIFKIKKDLLDFLKSLGQCLLKYNDLEAIRMQLTALIKR